jgi:hypothetical protein
MSDSAPSKETVERPSSARLSIRPAVSLSDSDISRLVIESMCAIRTVQRWAAGKAVNRTTNMRLEKACAKLGLVPKPKEVAPRIVRGTAA